MKKLPRWVNIIGFVLMFAAFSIYVLRTEEDNAARAPLWEEIREYQPTIKPEMIISITPHGYTGKPILDWKLDELALAMASVSGDIPNHPSPIGSITVEIDTTGTEIEPDVDLYFAYEAGNHFSVSFDLIVMKDGESFARGTFGGKELIEWAKSIGIAGRQDWSPW